MYPITNFTVQPLDMLITEDETQMTADLITCTGESYRMTFMTSDFSCGQKFKALLTRKTIALAFFGGEGDLELLKVFVSRLEWNIKTGVKTNLLSLFKVFDAVLCKELIYGGRD